MIETVGKQDWLGRVADAACESAVDLFGTLYPEQASPVRCHTPEGIEGRVFWPITDEAALAALCDHLKPMVMGALKDRLALSTRCELTLCLQEDADFKVEDTGAKLADGAQRVTLHLELATDGSGQQVCYVSADPIWWATFSATIQL